MTALSLLQTPFVARARRSRHLLIFFFSCAPERGLNLDQWLLHGPVFVFIFLAATAFRASIALDIYIIAIQALNGFARSLVIRLGLRDEGPAVFLAYSGTTVMFGALDGWDRREMPFFAFMTMARERELYVTIPL